MTILNRGQSRPTQPDRDITLAGTLVAGNIAPELLRQVLRLIKANRDTLLEMKPLLPSHEMGLKR